RIQRSLSQPVSGGPAFLEKIPVRAIPSDTFLFLESLSPKFSLIGHGTARNYGFTMVQPEIRIPSYLPAFTAQRNSVLIAETNAPASFQQPSVAFILDSVRDMPASALILAFY